MEWAIAGALISAVIGGVGWFLTRDYRELKAAKAKELQDFVEANQRAKNEAEIYATPRTGVDDAIERL